MVKEGYHESYAHIENEHCERRKQKNNVNWVTSIPTPLPMVMAVFTSPLQDIAHIVFTQGIGEQQ